MDNVRSTICRQRSAIPKATPASFDLCMGIRFCGETTAKTLAHAINHLLDFKNTHWRISKISKTWTEVAGSIHHFFSNKSNIEMLMELEKLG
jgi:DNA ligase (NAD+)